MPEPLSLVPELCRKRQARLIELDPLQRHVSYELDKVGDLRALWTAVERAYAPQQQAQTPAAVYPLRRSAADYAAMLDRMPDASREQTRRYLQLIDQAGSSARSPKAPPAVLGAHTLIAGIAALFDDGDVSPQY